MNRKNAYMHLKGEWILTSLFVLLFALPLVFAGNYGEGLYGSGIYGEGEEETTEPSAVSSGGGGGGGVLECTQNTDCGEGQYCFDNKCNDAQCFSDDVCDVVSGEVCWNLRCVKLFDIKIIEIDSQVKPGQDFEITYLIKGVADINDDVEVYFWIEKDGEIISSGLDTIYMGSFEERIETITLLMPGDATPGLYAFFAEIRYQDYKAQSYRTIESSLGSFQLFDISFLLDDSTIRSSDELSAIVTFENFGTGVTTVDLTFIILDSSGNDVYREEESVVVETEEILRKSFKGLDLTDGKYTLILRTLYNTDVSDKFIQQFEIRSRLAKYLYYGLIGIIILVIILSIVLITWFVLRRKVNLSEAGFKTFIDQAIVARKGQMKKYIDIRKLKGELKRKEKFDDMKKREVINEHKKLENLDKKKMNTYKSNKKIERLKLKKILLEEGYKEGYIDKVAYQGDMKKLNKLILRLRKS